MKRVSRARFKKAFQRGALITAAIGPWVFRGETATGATTSWVGPASGMWTTGSNWSSSYPGSNSTLYDVVVGDGTSGHAITLKGTNANLGYGTFAIQSLKLTASNDIVSIVDPSSLIVTGGSISGMGQIVFDCVNGFSSNIVGTNFVIGSNLTIRNGNGTGVVGSSSSSFTNLGTIDGNGKDISLAGNWTNQGTLLTGGSNLGLGGNFSPSGIGTIVNNGGQVFVTGNIRGEGQTLSVGSSIGTLSLLNQSGLTGIRIETTGQGQIGGSTTLDHVTLASNFYSTVSSVHNGITLDHGTLVLNGTSTTGANLEFQGSQTILGTGDIVLTSAQLFADNGDTLTISSGITLHSGTLDSSVSASPLINHGKLISDTANQTLAVTGISLSNDGTFQSTQGNLNINASRDSFSWSTTNSGTILASGSRTQVGQVFTNTGTVLANGGTFSSFGTWTNSGQIQSNSGTLLFSGMWSNSGTVSVKNAYLSLDGNMTTGSLGTISQSGGTIEVLGNLDNTNATVPLSGNAGTWRLNGGTILGGRIQSDSSVSFVFGSGTIENTVLSGAFIKDGTNSQLWAPNGLALDGSTISIIGAGTNSGITATSVSGTGSIIFGGSGGNLFLNGSGGTFNLGAGITVCTDTNNGTITAGPITNSGTIAALGTGRVLTVVGSNVYNTGTLHAGTGATLNIGSLSGNIGSVIIDQGGAGSFGGNFTLSSISSMSNATVAFSGNWINGTSINASGGSIGLLGSWSNVGGITVSGGTITLGGSASTIGAMTLSDAHLRIVGTYTTGQLQSISKTNTLVSLSGGTINNATSTYSLSAITGSLRLEGGTFNSGTISSADGALLDAVSGLTVIKSATLNTDLNIGNAATVWLQSCQNNGVVHNNGGTLQVGSLGAASFTLAQLGSIRFGGGTFCISGILDNSNHVLSIGTSPSWTVSSGGEITGGTIQTDSSASLRMIGGSLDGTTLSGRVDVGPGVVGSPTLGDVTFLPGSSIVINSGTSNSFVSSLVLAGTPQGSGEIVFMGPSSSAELNGLSFGIGTLGTGMTVRTGTGGGTIGASGQEIRSFGTISSQTNGMRIWFNNIAKFTNNGTVEARNGGTIGFSSAFRITNFSANTLTGGLWAIYANSTIDFGSSSTISLNKADIRLDGVGSTFAAINSLTNNQGSFTVTNGRAFSTAANLTNSGTIIVGSNSTLTVNGNLTNSGTVDVGGTVSVHYSGASPLPAFKTQLTSGFAGGAWNGTGIKSSTAASIAADPLNPHKTGVGYSDDSANSILLLRYTYSGDADLNGTVGSSDFDLLAANFGKTGEFWNNGDFNYDGIINALDFNALASNYGQNAALASSPADSQPMALGALVPEPTSIGLMVAAASSLLTRRRR